MSINSNDSSKEELIEKRKKEEYDELIKGHEHNIIYNKLILKCYKLKNSDNFKKFYLYLILISSTVVGLLTYENIRELKAITIFDIIVQFIFLIECIICIISEGYNPLNYWFGKNWAQNNYDFFITLAACLPLNLLNGGDIILFLGVVRILRLTRIIIAIHQLKSIVFGLISGVKSIFYISALLFLIFYLYAITGVIWFEKNDPFHFKGLGRAYVSLFQTATLDGWGGVMYVNIFGCDKYNGMGIYTQPEDATPTSLDLLICDEPDASPVVASLYFVSFITSASLVMMSFFVGVVTNSMSESMEMMRIARERILREKAKYKKKKAGKLLEVDDQSLSFYKIKDNKIFRKSVRDHMNMKRFAANFSKTFALLGSNKKSDKIIPYDDIENDNNSDNNNNYNDNGTDDYNDDDYNDNENNENNNNFKKKRSTKFSLYKPTINVEKIKDGANKIKDNAKRKIKFLKDGNIPVHIKIPDTKKAKEIRNKLKEQKVEFNRLRLQILARKAFAGEDLEEIQQNLDEGKEYEQLTTWQKRYVKLSEKCAQIDADPNFDKFIIVVILLSGLLAGLETFPILARGLAAEILYVLEWIVVIIFTIEIIIKLISKEFQPLRYFRDPWNIFDCIVVGGAYYPAAGNLLAMLRLLRLLRVLKLIHSVPRLQVIVSALFLGSTSIFFIVIILFLFFFFFAVLGVGFFGQNDPLHFRNLHIALITLFQISTIDAYSDIMYINMYGCDQYGYDNPEDCTDPEAKWYLSVVYFEIFVLFAALTLLSLFIGVVTTAMEQAARRIAEEEDIQSRAKLIAEQYKFIPSEIRQYQEIFDVIDIDDGGRIDESELLSALEAMGFEFNPDELTKIMIHLDGNQSGDLDFAEFLELMGYLLDRKKNLDDEKNNENRLSLKVINEKNEENNDISLKMKKKKN